VEAIARHGLSKLGVGDVAACASVSRATVYRYFADLDELVAQVAEREGRRFQEEAERALHATPDGPERIRVALQHVATSTREHPILSRIAETDPALLLRSLREEFPAIKRMFAKAFGPLLRQTALARDGIASEDELVDWLTRIMVSAYLFPEPEPDRMARTLSAVHRVLTVQPKRSATRGESRSAQKKRNAARQRTSTSRR